MLSEQHVYCPGPVFTATASFLVYVFVPDMITVIRHVVVQYCRLPHVYNYYYFVATFVF